MKENLAEVIMNPVRQRILQFLILRKTGTVREIGAELNDIPRPTLYRHIRILFEAGCLEIAGEQAVRGTIQRTYALAAHPPGAGEKEAAGLIQAALLSVMGAFARYFQREDAHPEKDMLALSSSTLMLTDEECAQMFTRIGGVINEYIQNKPSDGRKARKIVFISAPTDGKE